MYANNFNLSSYTFYALQLPSTNKDHLSPLSPSLSLDPSLSLRCRGTASSRRSHETSSRRSSRESPPTLRPRSATSPTCEDRKFDFDFNFNFNFYSIFLYSACLCMYMTLTRDLYPTFHARTYVRMHACMNVRTYVDIYIPMVCTCLCVCFQVQGVVRDVEVAGGRTANGGGEGRNAQLVGSGKISRLDSELREERKPRSLLRSRTGNICEIHIRTKYCNCMRISP